MRMNEINTTTGNSMSEIHNTERKKLNIKEHDFIYKVKNRQNSPALKTRILSVPRRGR